MTTARPPQRPADVETTPAKATPAKATPVETGLAETAPIETTLVEAEPVETASVETASVETASAETAPIETAPVEATRVEPGLTGWAERGWLPDAALRWGIRRLCAQRLRAERAGGIQAQSARGNRLLDELARSPLALQVEAANRQHYELPAAFFQACLGRRLKYSCSYYPSGRETLDQAEEAMLALYAQRADLADGQHILDLGCGWGALTLWLAERWPNARITAVSNAHGQREYILAQCRARGLGNVQVLTCDVNRLQLPAHAFDRCVSVEMFEHVRNYPRLLARIAHWLKPEGALFVHIFAHRTLAYPFQTEGADNWLGRHFFTGGLMPAADTLLHFQHELQLQRRWLLDGRHYQRTANHWLARQDAARARLLPLLAATYGSAAAARLWWQRWRLFWMACAELFGYDHGQQWLVAHYLLRPR